MDIVRRLANLGYCRYWLHWPLLQADKQVMVIALAQIDSNRIAEYREVPDLEGLGFKKVVVSGDPYYAIERTD